jgi:hypothetical protein
MSNRKGRGRGRGNAKQAVSKIADSNKLDKAARRELDRQVKIAESETRESKLEMEKRGNTRVREAVNSMLRIVERGEKSKDDSVRRELTALMPKTTGMIKRSDRDKEGFLRVKEHVSKGGKVMFLCPSAVTSKQWIRAGRNDDLDIARRMNYNGPLPLRQEQLDELKNKSYYFAGGIGDRAVQDLTDAGWKFVVLTCSTKYLESISTDQKYLASQVKERNRCDKLARQGVAECIINPTADGVRELLTQGRANERATESIEDFDLVPPEQDVSVVAGNDKAELTELAVDPESQSVEN